MSGHRPSPAPLPARISTIVLTGFMGAGKTTVGALLARLLGWDFVDSDALVESCSGMSVAAIFERRGESAFRDLEASAIRRIEGRTNLVAALGGGALERAETRAFLAALPNARIVFLEAPLDALLARCAHHAGGPVRPVLQDRERLAERWRSRLPWYRQAHITVQTEGCSPETVAASILEAIAAESRTHAGVSA